MTDLSTEISAWKSAAYDHFRYKVDVPPNIAQELTDACWENAVVEYDGDIERAALSSPEDAVDDELEYWSEQ
jgi:hypothetical protein